METRSVIGPDGAVQLYDMFVDGVWHGSRRTIAPGCCTCQTQGSGGRLCNSGLKLKRGHSCGQLTSIQFMNWAGLFRS